MMPTFLDFAWCPTPRRLSSDAQHRRYAPGFAIVLCVVALAAWGDARQNLFTPAGKANVLVFVSSDCPISNGYAPEIQRICADARARGVTCTLVYEDASIGTGGVKSHLDEYRYRDMPAVIDTNGAIARRAKATVTPQVVVVDRAGAVKYRGRIDNQYIALGKPRRVVTVHDLRDAITAVVDGRPIAQAETEAFGCFIPRTISSTRTPQ